MEEIKVLIVDDAYFMRDLIKKELTEIGCKIVGEAKNGKEAINMYINKKPDIITMDINMPELDGLEAIKKILEINPNAKILVITGDYDAKKDALNAGAIDFLKKPFQPAFLWSRIEKIYNSKNNECNKVNTIQEVYNSKNITNDTKENIIIDNQNNDIDDLLSFENINNKVDNEVCNKQVVINNDAEFEILNAPDEDEIIIIENNEDLKKAEDNIEFIIPENFDVEKYDKNKLNQENVSRIVEEKQKQESEFNFISDFKQYNQKDSEKCNENHSEENMENSRENKDSFKISIRPPRGDIPSLGDNYTKKKKSNSFIKNEDLEDPIEPILNFNNDKVQENDKKSNNDLIFEGINTVFGKIKNMFNK